MALARAMEQARDYYERCRNYYETCRNYYETCPITMKHAQLLYLCDVAGWADGGGAHAVARGCGGGHG